MARILITGGLGFIGSHAAQKLLRSENEICVVDNLSRDSPNLSKKLNFGDYSFNWNYFEEKYPTIEKKIIDIKNIHKVNEVVKKFEPETIIHTAGQTTAVDSIKNPVRDFNDNVIGTFNVLEGARKSNCVENVLYLSTNKLYGNNVNSIEIEEGISRYNSKNKEFRGIDENFSIDQSKHTPYGISKLSGDLYTQEYGYIYGLNTSIFRMSCIYGERQFGYEGQGWITHIIIQTILEKQIEIFGNGKQVRDILYIDDLTDLISDYCKNFKLYNSRNRVENKSSVFNIGGGIENSISILELITNLKDLRGKTIPINYHDWREADQKIYISDLGKITKTTGWVPKISCKEGITITYEWVLKHKDLFI